MFNIPEKLPRLKDTITPTGKLYNWNVLVELLQLVNVTIEQDVKVLIIAGDTEMLNDLLSQIY